MQVGAVAELKVVQLLALHSAVPAAVEMVTSVVVPPLLVLLILAAVVVAPAGHQINLHQEEQAVQAL
jgi:hypothetical protein